MSSLAFSVLGSYAASAVGLAPAIGWAAGSLVATLFSQKSEPGKSSGKLSNLKVQSSGYGLMIPFIFGTCRIGGNLIWATDLIEVVVKKYSGGKGASKALSSKTYYYYANLAIALCANESVQIKRCWANGILLWDNAAYPSYVSVYLGTETQLADPYIETYEKVGNVPAYRGITYIVFKKFPLEAYNMSIPQLNFEVVRTVNGVDQLENIVQYISSLSGLNPLDIDTSSLVNMPVEGFLLTNQAKIDEVLAFLGRFNFFDFVETGEKLVVKKRALGTPAVNIAESELVING